MRDIDARGHVRNATTAISGFKIVSVWGGAQLLQCRSVAFEVKVNTDQCVPLVSIYKCIPSQLYKGQACRAPPIEGAIVGNT
jgi:hypothetical protein